RVEDVALVLRRAGAQDLRLFDLLSRRAVRRAAGRPLPALSARRFSQMTRYLRRLHAAAHRARLAGWALALAFGLALAGCQGKPEFRNSAVTGADFGGDFSLTGHDGMPRTLADFRGKAVVIFFGYTQCPDVCPTTLSELAEVMKQLGPDADRVQVL